MKKFKNTNTWPIHIGSKKENKELHEMLTSNILGQFCIIE